MAFKYDDIVYCSTYGRCGVIRGVREYDDPEGRGRVVEYAVFPLHGGEDFWKVPARYVHEVRMTFLGPVLWPSCQLPGHLSMGLFVPAPTSLLDEEKIAYT